ncbi:MAG: tRNA1(Val) (adenine(37)-N6)-methyltransferase [Chitinophagales bacterium]
MHREHFTMPMIYFHRVPNNYFQFKQFRIDQDRCAMKVTTDACVLGAWVSPPEHGKILDIGTGTGLLSLMLAQRTHSMIYAIEKDAQSFLQAKKNFEESQWRDRIKVFHDDVRNFLQEDSILNPSPLEKVPKADEVKYDFIICNPPFFQNQLRSPSAEKNLARHDVALDESSLLQAVTNLLSPQGKFAVLLPYEQSKDFVRKAQLCNLFPERQLLIRNKPHNPFIRIIVIFTRNSPSKIETEILSVKNESNEYSDFFQKLLREFYLYL